MSIDAPLRARVPSGIREGGQFATEQRREAAVSLAGPGLPTVEESLAKVIKVEVPRGGPAFEQIVRDEFARLMEHVSPEVPPEWVAALFEQNHRLRAGDRTPFGNAWSTVSPGTGQMLQAAYTAGMSVDWPDRMAARNDALGAEGPRSWTSDCVKHWADGLTGDELDRLEAAGLAKNPRMATAFVGCDTDTVNAWIAAAREDRDLNVYLGRYLDLPGIGQYVRGGVSLDDVRLCHDLGVEPGLAVRGLTRPDGRVETGPAAIRELAQYATAAGQSTDQAHEGIAAGLPASALKEYGPKILVAEIPALRGAGVPGKVARSLRAKNQQMPVDHIARLHDAGISTGADYRAWEAVVEEKTSRGMYRGAETTHDWDAAMNLARAGVPLHAAAKLRSQTVPLSLVQAFHEAGVDDVDPWHAAAHRRTQTRTDMFDMRGRTAAYAGIAAFAKAGGTPEQMRRAQRAGVRLVDLPAHVRSTPEQLWQAGAAEREAILADEKRRFEQWGERMAAAPTPWDVAGPQDL